MAYAMRSTVSVIIKGKGNETMDIDLTDDTLDDEWENSEDVADYIRADWDEYVTNRRFDSERGRSASHRVTRIA